MTYRTPSHQAWKKYHGCEIPMDNQGYARQIHHANGDATDHSEENLVCFTIDEHIAVHAAKGGKRAVGMLTRTKERRKKTLHAKETIEAIEN